jgi:hypothetical protein
MHSEMLTISEQHTAHECFASESVAAFGLRDRIIFLPNSPPQPQSRFFHLVDALKTKPVLPKYLANQTHHDLDANPLFPVCPHYFSAFVYLASKYAKKQTFLSKPSHINQSLNENASNN